MEVIISGLSNETLTVNAELKPISSSADRLLGATVRFNGKERAYRVRGCGVQCVHVYVYTGVRVRREHMTCRKHMTCRNFFVFFVFNSDVREYGHDVKLS